MLLLTCCCAAGGCTKPVKSDAKDYAPAVDLTKNVADTTRIGIVVDVDETLSITDYRGLFLQHRADRSRAHRDAADVLTKLSREFEIIYLTARPQRLFTATRKWLSKQGFPAGPILTSYRAVDLFWPGPFKTRALAVLRTASPHLLIGIGDRLLDAKAYSANYMLSLIVNAERGKKFPSDTLLFDDWEALGRFFDENRSALLEEGALRAKFNLKLDELSADSISNIPRLKDGGLSVPFKLLLAGPALVGDWILHSGRRIEQTRVQSLLEKKYSMEKAARTAAATFGTEGLLKIQFQMRGEAPGYEVCFQRDGHSYTAWMDAENGNTTPLRQTFLPMRAEMRAQRSAGFDLTTAIQKAKDEVDGQVYEAELEIDDGRPAYEIALMSLGRFIEIELDARTGEILEVEDETAIR